MQQVDSRLAGMKTWTVCYKGEYSVESEEVQADVFFAQFGDATFFKSTNGQLERIAYFNEVVSVKEASKNGV